METWRLKARSIVKAATTLALLTSSCMCTNLEQTVEKKGWQCKTPRQTDEIDSTQKRLSGEQKKKKNALY